MKNESMVSVGDIVVLNSGGPKMTVKGFEREDSTPTAAADLSADGLNGLVRCVWFDTSARIQSHVFPAILVGVAKEDEPEDESHRSGVSDALARQEERQAA